MIEIVGTGFIITFNMFCAGIIFGIMAIIQPWSPTLKVIGAMIGMCAYALLPFVIAGAVV